MKTFKVGDEVQWMHCTSYGRSRNYTQRKGKISQLFGMTAEVKCKNGRIVNVDLDDLKFANEKGHLTELVEKMAKAYKGR